MRWSVIDSPIGDLTLAVDDTGLCQVNFGGSDRTDRCRTLCSPRRPSN